MAEMTEEEYLNLLALQQQAQANPLALVANQWGQGPGYLSLEDRPDSWTRAGDMNQIARDILGVTDIDFAEMVPGLYPQIQPPNAEDLQVQADPMLGVYANDPLMNRVADMVRSGEYSPTQAINALKADYAENPEAYDGLLPMTTTTQGRRTTSAPDWSGLEENTLRYLTADQEYNQGLSEVEQAQALYDDYVRNRSAYDKAVEDGVDMSWGGNKSRLMRAGGYQPFEGQPEPERMTKTAMVNVPNQTPLDLSNVDGGGKLVPGMMLSDLGATLPEGADQRVTPDRITSLTRNPLAGAKSQQRKEGYGPQLMGAPRGGEPVGPSRKARQEKVAKSSQWRAQNSMKKEMVGSKKEENLARIIAAYNTFIYGQ